MANKRSISTMRPTPSEKQRGPQSLPLRMENFGGAGKPESSKHFNAEIAAFASLWSVIFGKRGLVFNSLTFSCYLAIIFCKNAEMPHFRAAFLLCIFFINTFWSEMGDSNSRPDGPKPMSKPSGRTVSHSLALSGTPAVPLWNSIGLFISATAFGFWDLCGIEFCILKVLPTGFTSNSGCFLPQRAAQKLRRINKEISAAWGFL